VEPEYQVSVPVQPVPSNTTVPSPQLAPSTATGAAGIGFIVAITSVLGPSHPAALVHETQYEVVPERLLVENGDPVPIEDPPLATAYHFKVPVHPEAVKLTDPLPHRAFDPPVGATGTGFTVNAPEPEPPQPSWLEIVTA
jgi:hypothetical protein